ncbi:MAG: hypothetical protein WC023_16230, partial [Rhodocyclaceae bacterium]
QRNRFLRRPGRPGLSTVVWMCSLDVVERISRSRDFVAGDPKDIGLLIFARPSTGSRPTHCTTHFQRSSWL